MSDNAVYVLRARPATPEQPPGDAISINADELGNVIFQRERVEPDKIEEGLRRCSALAGRLIAKLEETVSAYEVTSVTLKLTVDTTVGLAFVGSTGLEAGIEVEISKPSKTRG